MISVADDTVLEMKRWFDASPDRVYAAWVTLEAFQAWIGPAGVQCQVPILDARVGGQYRIIMQLSDGRVIPVSGVFRNVDSPHRLVFTWGWEGDASRNSLITLLLRGQDGGTELTLRQEGLGSVENRDGHETGWSSALGKLVHHLANESVP